MRRTVMFVWIAALAMVSCTHDWDPVTRDGSADVTADLPCTTCTGGCFVLENDPSNCGTCGNVCVPPEQATGTCTAGVCGFACAAGYERCGDRCFQTDFNTSFCGHVCFDCGTLPHIDLDTITCSHGSCSLLDACLAHWGDCDGVVSNGCETDLTSADHCGSCMQRCASSGARCTADPSGNYACSN